MKRLVCNVAATLVLLLSPAAAGAAIIQLNEVAINIDGTVDDTFPPPPLTLPGIDDSGFDYTTGLGVLEVTVSGVGAHLVAAFYDHDLFNDDNTFFDDRGEALGAVPPGVGWEIDEPFLGDIFSNFVAGDLDETVFDGVSDEGDASMALSWDFLLDPSQAAIVTFITTASDPGGFRLHQFDDDLDIYLTSTLRIVGVQVPEPALLGLLGLAALASSRRLRRA
jgi:hypothetical protein